MSASLTIEAGLVRIDAGDLGVIHIDAQHPAETIERLCAAIRAAGASPDDVTRVVLHDDGTAAVDLMERRAFGGLVADGDDLAFSPHVKTVTVTA